MKKISCPKSCGECCKVILLTNNYKEKLQTQWQVPSISHNFYLKHFKQISKKEAIKIRPLLEDIKIHWKGIRFFICDLYDYEKNKCKGYVNWRPTLCTCFPYYENTVLDASRFNAIPDCYYVNQLMVNI
jgi:hypothetical protein